MRGTPLTATLDTPSGRGFGGPWILNHLGVMHPPRALTAVLRFRSRKPEPFRIELPFPLVRVGFPQLFQPGGSTHSTHFSSFPLPASAWSFHPGGNGQRPARKASPRQRRQQSLPAACVVQSWQASPPQAEHKRNHRSGMDFAGSPRFHAITSRFDSPQTAHVCPSAFGFIPAVIANSGLGRAICCRRKPRSKLRDRR